MKIIKQITKETNKKRINIILDILTCKMKYKASKNDYYMLEMYKMNDFDRKTIITSGKSIEYEKKYNNQKYLKYINNIIEFYNYFDKNLNRNWIEINEKNKSEINQFIKSHSQIIAKKSMNEHFKINTAEIKKNNIYKDLLNKDVKILDEEIKGCKELPLKDYNIKVMTLLGSVTSSVLEIGDFEKDGIIAKIDIETGIIKYSAVDKNKKEYEKFPYQEQSIKDFTIPNWEDIKEFCENRSLDIPAISYIEWNICLGNNKIYLKSATNKPKYIYYQLHRESNIGLIPTLKKIEERKIEQ